MLPVAIVSLLRLLLLLRIPFEWGGDHESYKASEGLIRPYEAL